MNDEEIEILSIEDTKEIEVEKIKEEIKEVEVSEVSVISKSYILICIYTVVAFILLALMMIFIR